MSHLEPIYRVWKIRYKHSLGHIKSIDITFIENDPWVFESIEDKQRNIHLYIFIYID